MCWPLRMGHRERRGRTQSLPWAAVLRLEEIRTVPPRSRPWTRTNRGHTLPGTCHGESRLHQETKVFSPSLPCDLSGPQLAQLFQEEIGLLDLVTHQDPLGNSFLKTQKPGPHSTPPAVRTLECFCSFVLLCLSPLSNTVRSQCTSWLLRCLLTQV